MEDEQKIINKNVCAIVMKAIRENLKNDDSDIMRKDLSCNELVEALQYTINHVSKNIPLKLDNF